MKSSLSSRLNFLASFYTNFTEVWDIGCDHGNLGLSFLEEKRVNRINLVDPSELVIKTLNLKLKDSYITIPDKIIIHQSKGQNLKIKSDQKKIIFIAGMGGKETREILTHIEKHLNPLDLVIISPHKNILELRAYLSSSSYGLLKEAVLLENQHFYQVLAIGLLPSLSKVSAFGSEIWHSPLGESYRLSILNTFKGHQDALSREFVAYLEGLSH